MSYNPAKALPVSAFQLDILPDTSLPISYPNVYADGEERSQTGRAYLLLISSTPGVTGGAMGVITLEGQFAFAYLIRSQFSPWRRHHRRNPFGGNR